MNGITELFLPTKVSNQIDQSLSVQGEFSFCDKELLRKMEAMNDANQLETRQKNCGTNCTTENGATEFHKNDSEDLLLQWRNLVENPEQEIQASPEYIRSLTRRGIPRQFRSNAWRLLAGADENFEYVQLDKPHAKRIDQEIALFNHRYHNACYQSNSKDNALFKILKAYYLYKGKIGCNFQGLIQIAKVLSSQVSESEGFAILVRIVEKYGLDDCGETMHKLGLRVHQFDRLLNETLPKLYCHFQKVSFDVAAFASLWFLTLSGPRFSSELSTRIMDVFLCEGIDMLFRLALAALKVCQQDLLQLNAKDSRKYIDFQMAQKLDQNHDLLINNAAEINLDSSLMLKLAEEYGAKVINQMSNEDMAIFRRFEIENHLLQQRLGRLEDENLLLIDELMFLHSNDNEDNDVSQTVRDELLELCQRNFDIRRRLKEAYHTIHELTACDEPTDKEIQVDDQPMIEHIHILQEEVMEVRAREGNYLATTKDLKVRMQELIVANQELQETSSDHCLAGLQSELDDVRLRESEATRLLRETRRKIKEFTEEWEAYLLKQCRNSNSQTLSDMDIREEIMGACIREADSLVELKETRQRLMELETQNHVLANHVKRQDEDFKNLQSRKDAWPINQQKLLSEIRETEHKALDTEMRCKEEAIVARLQEAEAMEVIADLKRQIADMESSYFEKWTEKEISKDDAQGQSLENDDDDDLKLL